MEALNSTAVNVSWTPVTLLEAEYHYTVHYTTKCCSFKVNYSANASFAVAEMQGTIHYQFSVSVTLNVSGIVYSGSK